MQDGLWCQGGPSKGLKVSEEVNWDSGAQYLCGRLGRVRLMWGRRGSREISQGRLG